MTTAIYMPILKGKQGELWSLRELGHRESAYPIIEIPRIKWDYAENTPAKLIESHIEDFVRSLEKALIAIKTCAIDACLLEDGGSSDSTVALSEVLSYSGNLGLPVAPATSLGRASPYNQLAGKHAREFGTGCVLRLDREDLYDPDSSKIAVDGLLDELEMGPEEVDLVVDFGTIREEDESEDLEFALQVIPQLHYLEQWHSLWFAGGSFPEFLTAVEPNSIEYIPRVEWTIWNGLVRSLSGRRVPRFSDYGVSHPISPDVDGRFMNMSANIRYTVEHHWLIVKGRSTRTHGFDQFHELCKELIGLDEYAGRAFSPGDTYLEGCAKRSQGPGNASKWRQAGTSHHIAYVTAQVEKASHLL